MKARISRFNLSKDALIALPIEERYTFVLAGHIFNELMLLMKMSHIARLPPNESGPVQDASVGTALFVIRLLVGKTYEAIGPDALGKPTTAKILNEKFLSLSFGTVEAWANAVEEIQKRPWFASIRNQGAFHYPKPTQLAPFLIDENVGGAYMLTGKRYGDTYFHWSEVLVSLLALGHVERSDPIEALEKILKELGELVGVLTDALAKGIQAFIATRLKVDGEGVAEVTEFDAPDFENFHLPYFYGDMRL